MAVKQEKNVIKKKKKRTKINASLFRLRHRGFRRQHSVSAQLGPRLTKPLSVGADTESFLAGVRDVSHHNPKKTKKTNVSFGFAMPFSSVCSQFALSSAVFGFFSPQKNSSVGFLLPVSCNELGLHLSRRAKR